MFPEHKLTRADLICSEQNSGRAGVKKQQVKGVKHLQVYRHPETSSSLCTYGQKKKNLQLVPRQKHVIRGHRQGEMSAQ